MTWNVMYTAAARQDLRNIYTYIAEELLVPETAGNQVSRIMKAGNSLEILPYRNSLYEEEPWYSLGMRYLPVDNYCIFYLPDETKQIVSIIRIMYKGRDIRQQLTITSIPD